MRILYEVGLVQDDTEIFENAEKILLKWKSELPQDYRKSVVCTRREPMLTLPARGMETKVRFSDGTYLRGAHQDLA